MTLNINSSTGFPLMRCSCTIRSTTSGVTEWYQTPWGYTTAIGPCSQTFRQLALVRDAVLTLHQPHLDQPLLQILPRRIGYFMWSAFRFGLIRAQEDVALEMPDSKRGGFLRKMLLFV